MTAVLRCEIRATQPIAALADARNAFAYLRDCLPSLLHTSTWTRRKSSSDDLCVIAIGKTGYGKSTTLNALLGEPAFETSDTRGCTRTMQSVEYRFAASTAEHYLSFSDLPGIGESPELDAKYFPLYRKALAAANVVLYFVRADQRDYSIDQRAFAELIENSGTRNKVILVVNAIDKIDPMNRSVPFAPSHAQQAALHEKLGVLSDLFGIASADIIPVAAAEDFNLDGLATAIARRLGSCVGASWQTVSRVSAAGWQPLQGMAGSDLSTFVRATRALADTADETTWPPFLSSLGFYVASVSAMQQRDEPPGSDR